MYSAFCLFILHMRRIIMATATNKYELERLTWASNTRSKRTIGDSVETNSDAQKHIDESLEQALCRDRRIMRRGNPDNKNRARQVSQPYDAGHSNGQPSARVYDEAAVDLGLNKYPYKVRNVKNVQAFHRQ